MTAPGNQWAVRRVAYAEIQSAFAEAGIKFAPKRVLVEAVTPALTAAGAVAKETAGQAQRHPEMTEDNALQNYQTQSVGDTAALQHFSCHCTELFVSS